MPEYYAVEVLCPGCKEWRDTSLTTTRETFDGDDAFLQGTGKIVLSCGHEVRMTDYETRLGRPLDQP